jgi:hypothetical protein
MSGPLCVLQWGDECGLSSTTRHLLLVLAIRLGGKKHCWPRIWSLMQDTGLSKPTVISGLQDLVVAGIIAIIKKGRTQEYHFLRPLVVLERDTTGQTALPVRGQRQVKPVDRSAGMNGQSGLPVDGVDRSNLASRMVKNPAEKGKAALPRILKEIKKERAAVPPKAPDGAEARKDLDSGGGGGSGPAPAPEPPAKAPVLGTTTSGGGYITPTPTVRSSDAYLDNPSADDALPKAEADAITDDGPVVDPAKALAEYERVKRALRSHNYPPRAASLTADEQIAVCNDKPRIKPAYLPADVLRQMPHRRLAAA